MTLSEGWQSRGAQLAGLLSTPHHHCDFRMAFPLPLLQSHTLSLFVHCFRAKPGKEHALNYSKHIPQGGGVQLELCADSPQSPLAGRRLSERQAGPTGQGTRRADQDIVPVPEHPPAQRAPRSSSSGCEFSTGHASFLRPDPEPHTLSCMGRVGCDRIRHCPGHCPRQPGNAHLPARVPGVIVILCTDSRCIEQASL